MFVMGSDWEHLTVVEGAPDAETANAAAADFVQTLGRLVPSLPGPAGVFTPYGRNYVDAGQHVEAAARECGSPYELALVAEQQHQLAARAVACLAERGTRLLLANNNHSGLLTADNRCIWGSHENYTVDRHPRLFAAEILPFLATRVYGGAGGIECPSANFLASVRAHYMQRDVGGGTTDDRAIHSLSRDEHHMGSRPSRYRYHLILGDGHRSQFNMAIQFGATALALKAIDFDRNLTSRLPPISLTHEENPWVTVMRRFNRLAAPGETPRVDPLVVAVQRAYLEGARRYADSLSTPADWIGRLLDDWEAMLRAFEHNDLPWLSARLDGWIKYAWLTAVLNQLGQSWRDLPGNMPLLAELALLDQNYHEICNPDSPFTQLDRAGALAQRVGEAPVPGSESEPFVPDTGTRAAARARFIKEHSGSSTMMLDWSVAHDLQTQKFRLLEDPFAREFGPWQEPAREREPAPSHSWRTGAQGSPPPADIQDRLSRVLAIYERGRYEEAHQLLEDLDSRYDCAGLGYTDYLRYRAWVQTRRGMLNGAMYLDRLSSLQPLDLSLACDYMFVYRFRGLAPLPELSAWTMRALALIAEQPGAACPPAVHEHRAVAMLTDGRLHEARQLLETVRSGEATWQGNLRILGRVLALSAEAYRRLGDTALARDALDEAERIQQAHGYEGDLADGTWLVRAKLESDRRRVQLLLRQARAVQTRTANRMGLARTLCLQARLLPPRYRFGMERGRKALQKLAQRVPALAECRLLSQILGRWEEWIAGPPAGECDDFWTL